MKYWLMTTFDGSKQMVPCCKNKLQKADELHAVLDVYSLLECQ